MVRDVVLTQKVGSPTKVSVVVVADTGSFNATGEITAGVTGVTGVTEKVAITLTGTATSAGELEVTAGGKTYTVPVAVGDSAATVANALDTSIKADAPTGFASTVVGGVVTLTSTTPNQDVEDLVVTIK